MAYEYGTVQMAYDSKSRPPAVKAAILSVYRDRGGTCQKVAMTMHPLEGESEP